MTARYRGRSGAGDEDHDLYATALVDVGDPARDRVSGSVLGTLAADVDGRDASSGYAFTSLQDTYGHRLNGRVFHAYADVRSVGPLDTVRLGRQLDYETPEVAWFDGASVRAGLSGRREIELGAYGGIPVHAYESSAEGDLVAGAWAAGSAWKGARARLDWMHLEDEVLSTERAGDLAQLSLWQRVGRGTRLEGAHSRIGSEARDARLAAWWTDARGDLVLHASHYRLLETQKDLPLELDPFYGSLFELFPYDQTRLLGSKDLTSSVRLEAGADFRRVDDEGDVGQFNRDFDRWHATATARELAGGTVLALTLESWDSRASDLRTWGVDLSKDWRGRLEASLGSYYSLYKYDLYQNSERDDVRTFYVRLGWKPSKARRFEVSYELEDADDDTFHTLRGGATWRF